MRPSHHNAGGLDNLPDLREDSAMKTMICAHCGKPADRAQVLKNAGYCIYCAYMTTSETMRRLMCARVTVTEWRKAGLLTAIKILDTWRYHRADVEALRANKRHRRAGLSLFFTS